MKNLLVFVFLLLVASPSFGQGAFERQQRHYAEGAANRNAQLKEMSERAAAQNARRREKAAAERLGNTVKLQRETRKIFGAPRIWSDGVYEMEGVLSEVKGKKAILLGRSGTYMKNPDYWITVKIDDLTETDLSLIHI